MLEIEIGEESVQVEMRESITFIDSFEMGGVVTNTAILAQTGKETFVIKPDSLRLDVDSLDKRSEGGGCFFCKSPEPEVPVLKEYLAYDFYLDRVEDGFRVEGERRGIKCICGSCYDEFCAKVGQSPELAVNIL